MAEYNLKDRLEDVGYLSSAVLLIPIAILNLPMTLLMTKEEYIDRRPYHPDEISQSQNIQRRGYIR